jgi:hypothetical protein
VADVAERGASQLALRQNIGQGVVKLKVLPPLHENNNS